MTKSFSQRINALYEAIEPEDAYTQMELPVGQRSLRMRLAHAFFVLFRRWL